MNPQTSGSPQARLPGGSGPAKVPFARRSLVHDRVRLAISVGARAFAVLLVLLLRAIMDGTVRKSTSYIDNVGADVFVESPASPDELGRSLEAIAEGSPLRLKMISNRGTKGYPNNGGRTDCVDHGRCRFVLRDGAASLDDAALLRLVGTLATAHRWMHLEKLEELDGEPAFTRAQGED